MKLLYLALFVVAASACKSPNSNQSTVKDIGYSNPGSYKLSHVFTLVDEDVVVNVCKYTGLPEAHEVACRYNETRIPLSALRSEIETQLGNVQGSELATSYTKMVEGLLSSLRRDINVIDQESKQLNEELSTGNSKDREEIEQRLAELNKRKEQTELHRDYYETALSLVQNLTSTDDINTESVINEITTQLKKFDIYKARSNADFLFPVSFGYQIWEGPDAARDRQMTARLKGNYAKADEQQRKAIALNMVAGPVLREAFAKVYQRSVNNGESPYDYGLNKLRNDKSKFIKSNGKTFAVAAEHLDSLNLQIVPLSIANGLDWEIEFKSALTNNINRMTCQKIFGSGSRTATRDELVNAAKDFYNWSYYQDIAGAYFWTPLTREGAKFGWGLQGWSTWLKEYRRGEHEMYRIRFLANKKFTTDKSRTPYQANLICILPE